MIVDGFAPLDRAARVALPGAAVLGSILLLAVPSPLPGAAVPDLALMFVYLAAAFRDDAFPVWFCFCLGLFADLMGAAPVGMHALTFLLCHAFAVSQQQHLQVVALLWAGFALVAIGTSLMQWLLVSAYHGIWLAPHPLLVSTLVSVAVFPLVSHPFQWIIGGVHNARQRA